MLWNLQDADPTASPDRLDPPSPVGSATFVDSQTLAVSTGVFSGNTGWEVTVWDLSSGSPYTSTSLGGVTSEVVVLAASADGKYLAGAAVDTSVKVWDLDNPSDAPLELNDGYDDTVLAVAISPDGQYLASGNKDVLHIWQRDGWAWKEPSYNAITATYHDPDSPDVECLAFSPDSRYLASGTSIGTIIVILDMNSLGASRRILSGHNGAPRGVAFSPDGQLLASTPKSDWLLWQVQPDLINDGIIPTNSTTAASPVLKRTSEGSYGIVFSPDSKRVALSDVDGTFQIMFGVVQVWTVASDVLKPMAENTVAGSRE